MNIDLIVVGKTDSAPVREIVDMYHKRVNFYARFNIITIADLRNTKSMTEASQRSAEGDLILKQLSVGDYVVLLDEHGKEFSSVGFADWLSKRMVSGLKRLVFVIGGPYGFSQMVYDRADSTISISKMTFSHQIIRAIFAEQLYRSFTILGNEPYHHE